MANIEITENQLEMLGDIADKLRMTIQSDFNRHTTDFIVTRPSDTLKQMADICMNSDTYELYEQLLEFINVLEDSMDEEETSNE